MWMAFSKISSAMKPIFDRIVEAKETASKHPSLFIIHLWIYSLIGFTVTFISLSYSHSACYSMISSAHLFNLHFAFNGSIFLGAVFHSNLSRRLSLKYVYITCLILISACFLALPHAAHIILLLCIVFIVFGTVLGISLSAVISNFVVIFKQQSFLLLQFLHLIGAFGSVTAVMFYQSAPSEHQEDCNSKRNPVLPTGPHIPSLEKFYLNPSLRQDYIFYATAILQIPLLILCLKTEFNVSMKTSISIRRTEYDDIETNNNNNNHHHENCQSLTQQSDVSSLKLVLLCSVVASIANIMYTMFPFLILAQPSASIFYYQLFLIFFMWGRAVSLFFSDYMAPYFLVGVSIFGCGIGCCCIASEQFLLVGSLIFGFFLAPLLPALVIYINHSLSLKSNNTFTLLSGHCSGHLIFPLLLTLTNSSNSRLFIAFNFVAIVILVIILVSILSLHAQIERMQASQSGLNLFVSRFLSGESLLKRTRSIRPLISRLRPNSYRRFANRRGLNTRSPSPAVPHSTEVSVSPDELSRLNEPKEIRSGSMLMPTRV
ncbi:RGS domain-containing protein [Caenorhabditis elegans]|uniref:RGS domain-containing protein n=1 Tax=Caenorhabditis elegans TaxID=6239 RepID=C6KRK5_CAEEL|nr:RGS domain-containing protein [Caenorhabditis elegans]CAZ65531.1 RGS domain-containing protein [Caenorhabditis elegans]|eukprot:NP_001255429.1 DAF-16/FOXO Controlled, germline Tumor affecting [Caenorhabditis elegans]